MRASYTSSFWRYLDWLSNKLFPWISIEVTYVFRSQFDAGIHSCNRISGNRIPFTVCYLTLHELWLLTINIVTTLVTFVGDALKVLFLVHLIWLLSLVTSSVSSLHLFSSHTFLDFRTLMRPETTLRSWFMNVNTVQLYFNKRILIPPHWQYLDWCLMVKLQVLIKLMLTYSLTWTCPFVVADKRTVSTVSNHRWDRCWSDIPKSLMIDA